MLEKMIQRITINEHSSIRIDGESILYFDPFRIKQEINDGDIVFVTHAHYDHFSPEDIAKVCHPNTVYVMPKSMKDEAKAHGFTEKNTVFLKANNQTKVKNITMEAVPSYNTDKPMHPKENGWLGYVVTVDSVRIYIAGDCDAMPQDIDCQIAMIPIGGTYTMNPKEAAEWINRMKPDIVIPTHYGTLVGSLADAELFEPLVEESVSVVRIIG